MDLYSRMVAFLKVLLPLAALAILATLFLISRGVELDGTIPFADTEIADRLRDQQITKPYFTGTTPAGDEILVTAEVARPAGPAGLASAQTVSARMTRKDGAEMTLRSHSVSVDPARDLARFEGDVVIATSTGMTVRTEALETALHGVEGRSPGTIEGTSPFGDFTAGEMQFAAKSGTGSLHMLFKGGVRLVYQPPGNSEN